MITKLLLITILLYYVLCDDIDDYVTEKDKEYETEQNKLEFEPKIPVQRREGYHPPNIECDSFAAHAVKCTTEAALMYNSSKKTPPLPSKIGNWCKAIKHLVNCAIDWNMECKDVSEAHFNDESVKGHMHVVTNICDNEWFLLRYDGLHNCIENTEYNWEDCYTRFKAEIDYQKNTSLEWTHYETHFYLCCARATFRRCSLDSVWDTKKCTSDQALVLQKFSVVVSQGDVFQDCDHNMMYENCPGGDPRPRGEMMEHYMDGKPYQMRAALEKHSTGKAEEYLGPFLLQCLLIVLLSFFI